MANWSPVATVYDPLKVGSIDGTDEEPHDRAIVRAMNAKYKPNKHVIGDPHCTIFVARLNPSTDEDGFWTAFRKYGKIRHSRLVRDIVTGFSKCYGFIEFEDKEAAREAYRYADKTVIDGHEVVVDFECERTMPGWVPRRLGGGFSGRKESGQLRFGCRDRPWRKPIRLDETKRVEGSTFRDRLRNMDRQERGDGQDFGRRRFRERERDDYRRREHYKDQDINSRHRGDRERYRKSDSYRHRERRSRSRE